MRASRSAPTRERAGVPEIALPDGSRAARGRARRGGARLRRGRHRGDAVAAAARRRSSTTTAAAHPTTPTWRPSCARCSAARRTSRCRTSRPSRPSCSSSSRRPEPTSTRFRCSCSRPLRWRGSRARRRTSRIDVRRFRPNLLVETEPGLDGYVESEWEGRKLRVGALELECTIACPRCVMITHGFDDLPKDTARSCARWCATRTSRSASTRAPLGAASVALGDPVELVGA